jgi:hypothetical protein
MSENMEHKDLKYGDWTSGDLKQAGIREHAVDVSDQDRASVLKMVQDHGEEWKQKGREIIEASGENAPATDWNGAEVFKGDIDGKEVKVELGSAAHSERHLSIGWKGEDGKWKEFQLLDI